MGAIQQTIGLASSEFAEGKANAAIYNLMSSEIMSSTRRVHRPDIALGEYHCSVPLVHHSRLTTTELGGIGKNLSEGWCLNFAVGCTHGCPFCYVDSIYKRFGKNRYGKIVLGRWGDYLLTPDNIDVAIRETRWERWKDTEVMLSSTHDPYIPELRGLARAILEEALPKGVRFCIQTRSTLVIDDLSLLADYRDQVRLQISLATSNETFARIIEPRVPSPASRLKILEKAKSSGIRTGVIIAPVFPPVTLRPNLGDDLKELATMLSKTRPDYIFGESLHVRGGNYRLLEDVLQEPVASRDDFDEIASSIFRGELSRKGLIATWWPEYGQTHGSRGLKERNASPARPIMQARGGSGICRGQGRTTGNGLRGISQF